MYAVLLPWLIIIPFVGGLLCWLAERLGAKVPRWIALITMGLTLALGLQLWLQGGYSLTQAAGLPQWQSTFLVSWIPRFGINFHLALDGLSLLMVVLTGLLGLMAVLCSWNEIEKYQGFFHLNLMWILGRRDRRVPRHRHVPVLLLLGNDAGADVLPHRALGSQSV
ncbi:NADH:ubiquinone oxidoreductase subunit 4 (subunit M) [Pantoea dispersa]|nr:NADH:ubiquinone oxidoreductase subunit 4 (subunit M) [Pantoea dispersa]